MAQLGELRNFAVVENVHEKQEARVGYCETKLQKIVLAYLVWGRLFFFGIVKALSSFECKDWWIVLALTLSSTSAYSLLFMNAVIVLSRNQHHLNVICKELTEICQQILEAARNEENVEAGVFSDGFLLIFRAKMFMLDHSRMVGSGRKVFTYFSGCALLAIAAIELYACKCLLCS